MKTKSVLGSLLVLSLVQGCAQQEEEPIFIDPEPISVGPSNGQPSSSVNSGKGQFCRDREFACVMLGVAVAGGIATATGGTGAAAAMYPYTMFSDRDLKRDVRAVGALENGLTLYAFRYIDDERTFIGLMADEVAADPRFAHAVIESYDGYQSIDYSRLNLTLVNGAEMAAAGEAALRRVTTQ